jgi:hypothetical protein
MPNISFVLEWTPEAKANYDSLKKDASQKKQYKAVKKALSYLATNPQHNSLNSRPFYSLKGPKGVTIWESCAQQNTPGAYRIFWYYGPVRGTIVLVAIIRHPKG